MVLCDNCNDKIATQKHHVKYFPEVTVPICNECHLLIHKRWFEYLSKKYIQYRPGDSKLFYEQTKKIDKFLSYLGSKNRKFRHRKH